MLYAYRAFAVLALRPDGSKISEALLPYLKQLSTSEADLHQKGNRWQSRSLMISLATQYSTKKRDRHWKKVPRCCTKQFSAKLMASFQLAQLIIIPDSSGREELHVGSIALVLGHLEQVPWSLASPSEFLVVCASRNNLHYIRLP